MKILVGTERAIARDVFLFAQGEKRESRLQAVDPTGLFTVLDLPHPSIKLILASYSQRTSGFCG